MDGSVADWRSKESRFIRPVPFVPLSIAFVGLLEIGEVLTTIKVAEM